MRDEILEAIVSARNWALVIAGASLAGFCGGYWIGHGAMMGPTATLSALAWVPIVWLGQPLIFIPYVLTALAFYLPLRFATRWLHLSAVLATFLAWLIVVAGIVADTAHWKFWRW